VTELRKYDFFFWNFQNMVFSFGIFKIWFFLLEFSKYGFFFWKIPKIRILEKKLSGFYFWKKN
jgi:hypothetical protein